MRRTTMSCEVCITCTCPTFGTDVRRLAAAGEPFRGEEACIGSAAFHGSQIWRQRVGISMSSGQEEGGEGATAAQNEQVSMNDGNEALQELHDQMRASSPAPCRSRHPIM